MALLAPAETAYWNPSITTGKDGRATVTFAVPELDRVAAAGQGHHHRHVGRRGHRNARGEEGTLRPTQAAAKLHRKRSSRRAGLDPQRRGRKGPIDVTLKMTIGGKSVEEKKTITADAKGVREVAFPVGLQGERGEGRGERKTVAFELSVSAGGNQDVSRRTVPLTPYGVPVYAAASGAATTDATVWVEPPRNMAIQRPTLSILIGPTIDQSLLDVLLAAPPACQIEVGRIASDIETAASDLMAAIGLQKLLGVTRDAAGPQAEELDARIRGAVSLLLSAQSGDGGWGWTGTGSAQRALCHVAALWALSLARKAGYNVPDEQLQKAVGLARRQITAAADNDYESKAILLHALSTAGQGDFALANRLHRERLQLSAAALANLALALAEMDRKPMAGELLDVLAKRNLNDVASRRTAAEGSLAWCQSPAELHGAVGVGARANAPQLPKTKEVVDWLLAHRVGHRWSPDKATGPAALALCRWASETRFDGDRYTLKVFVNDVWPRRSTSIRRPARKPRRARQSAEKGRKTADQLPDRRPRTLLVSVHSRRIRADRKTLGDDRPMDDQADLRAAPLEMDGRHVPRGFGIVQGTVEEFKNPMTQLTVGHRGLVRLDVKRKNEWVDVPEEQLEYLVVTEPLPAGVTVVRIPSAAVSSGSSFRRAQSRFTWAIAARWTRSSTKSTAIRPASSARCPRSCATPTGRSNWRHRSRNRWSFCGRCKEQRSVSAHAERALRNRPAPLREGRSENGRCD